MKKLKVRWTTAPIGGGLTEAIVEVDDLADVGSMTVFLNDSEEPVLVIPSNRMVDAVEVSTDA